MPLFKTQSAAIYGIDARLIDVEVDMYMTGNPRDFVTVGMPDTAVRESRERIRSAIVNSGFRYPNKSFTINLAPANVRKEGAGFDLAHGDRDVGRHGRGARAWTDISSSASCRWTGRCGRCAARYRWRFARATGAFANLIVPAENAAEAAVVEGVRVFGVQCLAEVVALLTRPEEFQPVTPNAATARRPRSPPLRIFATCAGRPWPSERWKWRPRARTTC